MVKKNKPKKYACKFKKKCDLVDRFNSNGIRINEIMC